MWAFDINYIMQNNTYVQLLAMLSMFQPLLHDLRQLSTEHVVKLAVVHDFGGAKILLPLLLLLPCKHLTG